MTDFPMCPHLWEDEGEEVGKEEEREEAEEEENQRQAQEQVEGPSLVGLCLSCSVLHPVQFSPSQSTGWGPKSNRHICGP